MHCTTKNQAPARNSAATLISCLLAGLTLLATGAHAAQDGQDNTRLFEKNMRDQRLCYLDGRSTLITQNIIHVGRDDEAKATDYVNGIGLPPERRDIELDLTRRVLNHSLRNEEDAATTRMMQCLTDNKADLSNIDKDMVYSCYSTNKVLYFMYAMSRTIKHESEEKAAQDFMGSNKTQNAELLRDLAKLAYRPDNTDQLLNVMTLQFDACMNNGATRDLTSNASLGK